MRARTRFINKYLDRITADTLAAYNDMAFKAERFTGREGYLSLIEPSSSKLDTVRVQGGRISNDEKIINAISARDEEEDALEYLSWVDSALDYLETADADAAWIVRTYFIDGDKDISKVQRYFNVERSAAYDKVRQALKRISRLLYW